MKTRGAFRMTPAQAAGVENGKNYLVRLKLAIEHLHNCSAYYVRTEHVIEGFKGKIVWNGHVEVFALVDHPKAKRAYAWSRVDKVMKERFVVVLEIPPIDSALKAVQVKIVKSVGDNQKKVGKTRKKTRNQVITSLP